MRRVPLLAFRYMEWYRRPEPRPAGVVHRRRGGQRVGLLGFLAWCIGTLALTSASASAASPPITAQWLDVGPSKVSRAVVYEGQSYAAGLSLYKIGVGDVPAYSLSLKSAPGANTKLEGVAPAASMISGLRQATYLAGCSSARSVAFPLNRLTAAAYQVAIWHFTDDVALSRQTMPAPRVRGEARALAVSAERAVASHSHYCSEV